MSQVTPAPRHPAPHLFVRSALVALALLLPACATQVQLPPDGGGAAVGALRVEISGVDAPAAVRVTGVGFSRDVTATTTLEGLEPGRYEVAAAEVVENGRPFSAVVTGSPADVRVEETAAVAVRYAANLPPRIDGLADAEVLRNTRTPRSATLLFSATDPDGDAVTVTAVADDTVLPDPLAPVCDASGACQLVLTPAPDATAEATITVTADDGRGGVVSASVVLSVLPRLVTSRADAGPGTLRDALAAAVAGDVVGFAESAFGTIALTSEIAIGVPVTIEGPGTDLLQVDGGEATRLLTVDAEGVAMRDLTLMRGFATAGGAVLNRGELTLERVAVIDSVAADPVDGGRGGGIHSLGVLTLVECRFVGNQAATGGAVHLQGTVRFTGGVMIGNLATAGGAIYMEEAGGTSLELVGVRIEGNEAAANGGGIRAAVGLTATGATRIANNRAAGDGGGVFVASGGAAFGSGVVIEGNEADLNGGGVAQAAGEIEMQGAIVRGNSAAVDGGGVFAVDRLILIETRIEGNVANDDGGGVALGDSATLDATDSDIVGNVANNDGGGIDGSAGSVRLTGGAIEANTAAFGGGVRQFNGELVLDGTKLIGNAAIEEENGIGGSGGAVFANTEGSIVFRGGVLVEGNSADFSGGGLFVSAALLDLGDVVVRGNSARNGGGLLVVSSAHLDGATIVGNSASFRGGGIFLNAANVTLLLSGKTEVRGNSAAFDGGGIFMAAGTVEVRASTIGGSAPTDGNVAGEHGGGIASLTSSAGSAHGLVLGGGSLVGANRSGLDGGGIWLLGRHDLQLNDVQLTGNVSEDFGGGMFYDLPDTSTASLTDVEVVGNSASEGGGFYRDGTFKIDTSGTGFAGNAPDDLAP